MGVVKALISQRVIQFPGMIQVHISKVILNIGDVPKCLSDVHTGVE